MKTQRNGALGWSACLHEIKRTQRSYAKIIFEIAPWTPDMLSDIGHLGLVDVPMLVSEMEKQRNGQSDERDSDGDPGSDGIGLPESPLQFVLPEQSVTDTTIFVEACNPLAHFLIRFLAKLPLGIRLRFHISNYNSTKVGFVYFGFSPGEVPDKAKACLLFYRRLRS